jgi:uncharacterized protein YerC
MINMEIWKTVPLYENRYEVSNFGRIKSLKKPHRTYEKILKPVFQNGYYAIDLGNGINIKRFLLHRIVCSAFNDNLENKPQVNHKDGNKLNNSLDNLEWCTRSENQLHAIETGLRTTKGIKNSQSKLTEDIVLKILKDNRMYKLISNEYNISIPTISDIKRGYSWTHITNLPNKKTGNRQQILVIK